jgi:hypothetical protein
LASGEERRFEYFSDINQIESAISEIPFSLYSSKKEENKSEDNNFYKLVFF